MKQRRRVLLAGLALIATTNAVALIGAAYNRSGDPDALVELTERELALPYDYGFETENSGVALQLNWRAGHAAAQGPNFHDPWGPPAWLSKEKLAALGFDVSQPLTSREARRWYEKMLPRAAYLVLEYDGEQYRKALERRKAELAEEQALLANNPGEQEFQQRVERAQERWEAEQRLNSRLFIIDAGLDKEALRARYADRASYIIMAGQVGLQVLEKEGVFSVAGFVQGLNIGAVHVPHKHLAVLEPLLGEDHYQAHPAGPRYAVRLGLGQRLEPWVEALVPIR